MPTDFMRSRWLGNHYPAIRYSNEEQKEIVVDDHDWLHNVPDLDYGEQPRDFAIARADDGYWALTHEAAELVHDIIMGDDD